MKFHFQEKTSEVKELLQIMYPSLEVKVVTKGNCYFLLDLAREYQIASITQKCEDFLVSNDEDVLAELIVGQNYELKTLVKTCVYVARRLSLKELKKHTMRDEIEPDNYLQIAEGIIERLEENCKEVRASSLKKSLDLSKCIYYHAKPKGYVGRYRDWYSTSEVNPKSYQYLALLKQDESKNNCSTLSDVAKHLEELERTLYKL